jgi:hypothetical protein
MRMEKECLLRISVFERHKTSKKGSEYEKAKIADENNDDWIFDAKCIICHKFVPEKQTVKGKFHEEAIKRSLARVHRVRPEFQEGGSWFSSARQCTDAFFGLCLRVFGETRDPHVISSTLFP